MSKPVSNDIHWRANAKTDSSSIIRLGFWSVGALLLIFLLWAFFFPLASAVITPGTFISDGKNKLVQHQRGGRVKEIFVREVEKTLLDAAGGELKTVSVTKRQRRRNHSDLQA